MTYEGSTQDRPATDADMLGTVQTILAQFLADGGDRAPRVIAPESQLVEFGVNSVQLLQIHARLEDTLGVEIPATVFFDHDTVGGLADYLANNR